MVQTVYLVSFSRKNGNQVWYKSKDAEAAKTKAPTKKDSAVNPKPIIGNEKETAGTEEVDNPEHLMVDQENEPLEPMESDSLDVPSIPSVEAEERQVSELDETTVVFKDGKIQLKKDYVIKFDDNDETIKATMINKDCKEEMKVELEELKQFEGYEIVSNEGNYRISCIGAYCKKGDEARAH